MKSVGIITYHHYCNYGTMLQAYALQHYISSLGYDAELIDFLIDESMSHYDMFKLRLRRLPVYVAERKKYVTIAASREKNAQRNLMFENFYKNNLVVGRVFYSTSEQLKKEPPIYDGYIVGSDQTWNPNVSHGPEAFFLTFVNDDKKKGCYAPSVGLSRLSDAQKDYYRKRLSSFCFLSCRESLGAEIISKAVGRPVTCVLDPTLLMSSGDWMDVASKSNIKEPYILTYFLGEIKKHREFVEKLSSKTGYKVVSLPMAYLEMGNEKWEQKWVGPDEFLSLMKNASYICTDSFHGTAFAINFQVPFFSFCKRKEAEETSDNSRIHNILKMFNLEHRLITETNLPKELGVDFSESEVILSEKRKESAEYLERMLKTITL